MSLPEDTAEPAWYIDAWAVHDGVAFASFRLCDTINATNTVFFSVPDLEPIPVGRISTALSATRRGFQDRLADENGNEIAFQSLEEVRQAIRRAYVVSSGRGPDGIAGTQATAEPLTPGGAGGAYFDEAVNESDLARSQWYHDDDAPVFSRYIDDPTAVEELGHLLQRFAEATLLDWEQSPDLAKVADTASHLQRSAIREWYMALYQRCLWRNPKEMWDFARERPIGSSLFEPRSHLRSLLGLPVQIAIVDTTIYSPYELLTMAPCSPAGAAELQFSRLFQPIALMLSDGQYLREHRSVVELIPALLGAFVMVPSGGRWHHDLDHTDGRGELVRRALRWLQRELALARLPDAAERVLHAYALHQIGVSHGTPAPPTTPQERVAMERLIDAASAYAKTGAMKLESTDDAGEEALA